MLIRHFMSSTVTTLIEDMSPREAWAVFEHTGLRRAPVVDAEGNVIGILTDRDLAEAVRWNVSDLEHEQLKKGRARVSDLLNRDLISVDPSAHLDTAAQLMLKHKIGALPVMEKGRLRGIITESDIFRVFVQLKAVAEGTLFSLHWPHDSGMPPDPARIAIDCGVELREQIRLESPGKGTLVDLRVVGDDLENFRQQILKSGYILISRHDTLRTRVH
jgi:acetoin utilization protein AcuB